MAHVADQLAIIATRSKRGSDKPLSTRAAYVDIAVSKLRLDVTLNETTVIASRTRLVFQPVLSKQVRGLAKKKAG